MHNKTPHSHDHFVKQAMSHVEVARDFFANYLPPEVLEKIDLSTLKPQKDSFVDNTVGVGAVDALFSVKFDGEDGYLYLLSEFQSSSDRLMSLRILKYMLMICEYHYKSTKSKYLPLIYPVIYYSGKQKYSAPLDFFQLFTNPVLAKSYFTAPYQLIDIAKIADEDMMKCLWIGVMFYLMKHIQDADILPNILAIKSQLKEIAGKNFLYVEAIFQYIINNAETDQAKQMVNVFSEITPADKQEVIMTIAEQLKLAGEQHGMQLGIQQGIKLGEQRGIEKEKYDIALKMFEADQSIEFIYAITGIDKDKLLDLFTKNTSKMRGNSLN